MQSVFMSAYIVVCPHLHLACEMYSLPFHCISWLGGNHAHWPSSPSTKKGNQPRRKVLVYFFTGKEGQCPVTCMDKTEFAPKWHRPGGEEPLLCFLERQLSSWEDTGGLNRMETLNRMFCFARYKTVGFYFRALLRNGWNLSLCLAYRNNFDMKSPRMY